MNTIIPADMIFACRLEDKGDGELIMRRVKVRENNGSEDVRFQLKYDIADTRVKYDTLSFE